MATLIVPSTDAARTTLGALLAASFGFPVEVAPTWFDDAGHDNLRAMMDGEDIVAGCIVIPMGQWLGGRRLSCLGIAGVGVRLDRLRRGLARDMMGQVLREARADGFALSTLYGSQHTLYRGVGYEQAGLRCLTEVDPAGLRRVRTELEAWTMTEADFPAMDRIHAAWGARQPGALDRGPYCWKRVRVGGTRGRPSGLLVGPREAPEGYLTFQRVVEGDGFHRLRVLDVAATSHRALCAVLGLLGDLTTMARAIEVPSAPTDPLWGLPSHPRWKTRVQEPWMVRVVDVRGALQGRGYAPGVAIQAELDVLDDVIAENHGRWVLTVQDGSATVERGGSGQIVCSARGLATVFTGYRSPDQAAQLDLMSGPQGALDALGAALAGPMPWMRDMF